ncbi:uncharacterized protein LOC131681932 [Topomyia yanbarensis]|uniref:uncharacterized protein LOC131681932 n=1 Tax=Topomyia yanbarensis TaxID=2498891 RepID=UPI00273B68C1|nr:uncharacterized protein LOC131681932 [Topomyia yanbarensis]
MRSLLITVALLCGLSVILADRPKTKAVIEQINELRPRYREIQDFVIETLSDARLNTSAKINIFHQDILLVKETFVLDAILKEEILLYQINNQPAEVDRSCLAFVQTLSDSIINLAGAGFSNCVSDVSNVLNDEVAKFYTLLQKDETDYVGLGLLDVFKGENIFSGPDSILEKLALKASYLEENPLHLFEELYVAVTSFGSTLDELESAYIVCMTDSEQRLKGGFQLCRDHMLVTCRSVEVPGGITTEPPAPETEPEVEPETSEPLPPESEVGNEHEPAAHTSEILKAFRERFGLN